MSVSRKLQLYILRIYKTQFQLLKAREKNKPIPFFLWGMCICICLYMVSLFWLMSCSYIYFLLLFMSSNLYGWLLHVIFIICLGFLLNHNSFLYLLMDLRRLSKSKTWEDVFIAQQQKKNIIFHSSVFPTTQLIRCWPQPRCWSEAHGDGQLHMFSVRQKIYKRNWSKSSKECTHRFI